MRIDFCSWAKFSRSDNFAGWFFKLTQNRKLRNAKMATSPNTSTLTTPKKKEESLLDKIGTLGRKKKQKEGLQKVQ